MTPRRRSCTSMAALSMCSLAVLILCLHLLLDLDYASLTITSINYNTMITSLTGGQRRKLFLIDDPKTVEQKPLSVGQSNPISLCKSVDCKTPDRCELPLSCIHPDPPGAPLLNTHRGLSLLLNWKDCSTVQQCLLAYVMIPKAGSTLVKNTMLEVGEAEPVWLSPPDGTHLTNNNPLIFTLIRDPCQRVVSAYSTIMSRREGIYGTINGVPARFPDAPDDVNDIAAWTQQFKQSIRLMLLSVKENGWYNANTNPVWDEHILPQVEFMRGLNVSFIGCVSKVNEALNKFQLQPSSQQVYNNSYEHNDNMPGQKFASYDLIDEETNLLLRDVYAEDYKLFLSTCA
ncbi:hypothetical protein ACHAW6_004757 [Cyclotella cf. meneghiniana]